MDYTGGKPVRPPQSNGQGTPGMQQARAAAGSHMTPPPSMPYGAAHQQHPQLQQQQMSGGQLHHSGLRRPPPQAAMTPGGMRVLNIQRFPGGPVNQRRILVPVTQTPPTQEQLHMQQSIHNMQQAILNEQPGMHHQQQGMQHQQHMRPIKQEPREQQGMQHHQQGMRPIKQEPRDQQGMQHHQQGMQHQQHMRPIKQEPREGETPPPRTSSPMGTPAPARQQLMQPVHLQLPPGASAAAAGMVRRPMPIAGTPQGRQLPPGISPAMHQQQMPMRKISQPRAPGAPSVGRPQQQMQQQQAAAGGTPRSAARAPGSSGARGSAAAGQSQQQQKYNRQQMQLIMRSAVTALEKVRQLRSTVIGSYIGGTPGNDSEDLPERPMDAAPQLSEDQEKKRLEKMQTAQGILDSLHDLLRYLPNSTSSMFGGKEWQLANIMGEEELKEGEGETVGAEIERTLAGEELRSVFIQSVLECMSKMPIGRSVQAAGLKEGLSAHADFMHCLQKLQKNKRLQQQRNLTIHVLNQSPRDTRFELCISTTQKINPTTTLMRAVITVCDGCLTRATFLGPNELVDSLTEERSTYLVYRQMSINATEALLATAKGRQMSLMSSINSIFAFLQNYPTCLSMPCCECNKSLRDFMPPTRFVALNPLKYAHPDCHQPDR